MARWVIGLDLSTGRWKGVIVASGLKDRRRVEGYVNFPPLPFPEKELFSEEHSEEDFAARWEEWAAQAAAVLEPFLSQARSLVAGIGPEALSLRVLELPFTQPGKLRNVLPFEVESSLPFDAEELIFDFLPLRQEEKKTRLLSAAISRQRLAALLSHLKGLALDPVILTATPLCLHHLAGLVEKPGESGSERLIFLSPGKQASHLSVVDAGQTVFLARLPGGWAELDASPAAEEEKVSTESRLLRGIRRHLHFLEGYAPRDSGCPPPLRRIILVGEGVTPTVAERIEAAVGIETRLFSFPPECLPPETPIPGELQPELAPALALALSAGAARGRAIINFRREEFAYRPEQRLLLRRAVFPGTLALLFLVSLVVYFYIVGSSGRGELNAIKHEMQHRFEQTFPGRPAGDPNAQLAVILKEYKEKQKNYEELVYPSSLRVLTEISNAIPAEINVTITAFDCKGKDVSLSGIAFKLDETNEMEKRLAAVPIFTNVKLDKATATRENEWRFKITWELKKETGP